jgi:hypothetical protein
VTPARGTSTDHPASAPEDSEASLGVLRTLLSFGWLDVKIAASILAVVVYGVVRVAYDAFYSRLGITPEDVGLSEAAMVARAALLFVVVPTVTVCLAVLWFVGLNRLIRVKVRSFAVVSAVATAGVVAIVLSAAPLRGRLASDHLVYFCFSRCKFAPLSRFDRDELSDIASAGAAHGYRVIDIGPAWFVALPLLILLAASVFGLVRLRREPSFVFFGLLMAASLTAGMLAPALIKLSHSSLVARGGQTFVTWAVFALLTGAMVTGVAAFLSAFTEGSATRTQWSFASFVLITPLVLGFATPDLVGFLEDEGWYTLTLAIALWIALTVLAFWWPLLNRGRLVANPAVAVVVAVALLCTFLLARARGLNLAKQVAQGDVLASGSLLLPVRPGVVCLDPTGDKATFPLPRRPYRDLGESSGMLVLYDYVADRVADRNQGFAVRVPVGDVIVRPARYNPTGPNFVRSGGWDCGPD